MKKLKLSLVDRSAIVRMIPKTGSLKEVKQSIKFVEEVGMTEDEQNAEMSFNDIRDPKEKDKALNEFYNTQNDFEMSDELYEFLKSKVEMMDANGQISVEDSLNLFTQLIDGE